MKWLIAGGAFAWALYKVFAPSVKVLIRHLKGSALIPKDKG